MATFRHHLPEIQARAAGRFGLLTTADLRELGLSRQQIQRLASSGFVRPIFPNVFALPGTTLAWHAKLEAARLAALPAVAFGRSAGVLHGLDGVAPGIVEVMTTRHVRGLAGVAIHRRPHWGPEDETVAGGIPATTVERTLVDLAGLLSPRLFRLALDSALRGHTNLGRLTERFEQTARRGRPGTRLFRTLLATRAAQPIVESALESDFLQLLQDAGLPTPVAQFPVLIDGRVVARLDFAYPDLRIGIELDGYQYHSSREAFERDRRRLVMLTNEGWRIFQFTYDQVHRQARYVLTEVKRAREAAFHTQRSA